MISLTPQDEAQCIEAHKFTTIPQVCELIYQQRDDLLYNISSKQYLLFYPVSSSQFTTLDEGRYDERQIIPKNIRLSCSKASKTLIAKMPSQEQDAASTNLMTKIHLKLRTSGVPQLDFIQTGSATHQSKYTSKEPDASFKPSSREKHGWPSLVIEAGLSESLAQLRQDAKWWLTNSDNQVRIALVTSVQKDNQSIVVEVWEMEEKQPDGERRVTRSSSQPTPTLAQEITIAGNGEVRGGPLVLGFEKMLARQPGQGEGDVVFSTEELRVWAGQVWEA